MPKIKGRCVWFIRKLIQSNGKAVEDAFLAKFTPEEVKQYHTIMPVIWVSEAFATKIGVSAGEILCPGDPHGTRKMGRLLALDDFKGIYKILFSIATIPFVIQQSPIVWKTYHEIGRVETRKEENANKVYFLVKDYPDMLEGWRELLCGYIQGIVEQTGGRNVKVGRDRPDTATWRWIITWD